MAKKIPILWVKPSCKRQNFLRDCKSLFINKVENNLANAECLCNANELIASCTLMAEIESFGGLKWRAMNHISNQHNRFYMLLIKRGCVIALCILASLSQR